MRPEEAPVIRAEMVFHIGTLVPAARGRNTGGTGVEGHCLSVSACPHAWRFIARLGGNPLWEMTRQGAFFVDLTAVRERGLVDPVIDWAKEEKLVSEASFWRAWRFEADSGRWIGALLRTEEAALEESGYGEGPDGRPGAEAVSVPVGTWKLGHVTGAKLRPDEDATEYALLAFAMQVPGAEGVWWRDPYDPDEESAPKGAIFPERIRGWKRRQVPWADVDDEEALSAFGRLTGSQ